MLLVTLFLVAMQLISTHFLYADDILLVVKGAKIEDLHHKL